MTALHLTLGPGAALARIHGPLVMPFSNVLHLSFPDKIRAAQLAGFGGLSMHPHEVLRIVAEGTSIAEMLARARDAGIGICRLDPLTNWNPHWLPDNMEAGYIAGHDISAERFFAMCEQFGVRFCSLNASFPAGRLSFNQIVDYYASTCQLGARHGVTCDIENLPMWGVATLQQAWDIVRTAQQPNGGIVFDTLHYIRSHSTIDVLTSIPGEQIHCVQLNDGPLTLAPGIRLQDNCFDRLWPGEGEFPLTELLGTLARTGGLNQVNPEVFSPANKALGAEEIARRSSDSIHRVLARAGISA